MEERFFYSAFIENFIEGSCKNIQTDIYFLRVYKYSKDVFYFILSIHNILSPYLDLKLWIFFVSIGNRGSATTSFTKSDSFLDEKGRYFKFITIYFADALLSKNYLNLNA